MLQFLFIIIHFAYSQKSCHLYGENKTLHNGQRDFVYVFNVSGLLCLALLKTSVALFPYVVASGSHSSLVFLLYYLLFDRKVRKKEIITSLIINSITYIDYSFVKQSLRKANTFIV